jgi:hypothetical protein
MAPELRLYEDILTGEASTKAALPAMARMIYVVHGAVRIDEKQLGDGEAWHGEGAVALKAGEHGATLWRFELAPAEAPEAPAAGAGIRSHLKLTAALQTLPAGDLLLRGDSVAFPPGGCAYAHVHHGPGIRCLLEGGIRIDTHGQSTSYGPGAAWYESGPAPVFAQAAADRGAKFIRVMVLRRELLGKSSIRYVNDADKDKPKAQKYQVFVDAPIAFRKGS